MRVRIKINSKNRKNRMIGNKRSKKQKINKKLIQKIKKENKR